MEKILLVIENHSSSLYFANLSKIFDIRSSVEEIAENTPYVYVIDIERSERNLVTEKSSLKKRVIADCRNKIAKILFYEPWEANDIGYNYSKKIKKFAKRYRLPTTAIAFCDSNFKNDNWYKACNINKFSIMFFEEMCGANLDLRRIKTYKKRAGMIQKQHDECEYRYINLNRKIRPHRTSITREIAEYHDDVSLWSYIEDGKILDIHSTVNDLDIASPLIDKAYLNIVSESHFGTDKLFLTEKVFKPISIGQPFIVVGSKGTLKKLQEMGYYTFSEYINEEYDMIEDDYERTEAIKKELRRLTSMPFDEFKDLMSKCYKQSIKNINVLYLRYNQHITYQELYNEIKNWTNLKTTT